MAKKANSQRIVILGAGVTGLAAGIKTGAPVYEANSYPGGICRSYTKKGYRFEVGGGHWIFGDDQTILKFIKKLSPLKKYQKKSAVWLVKKNLYIPYPIQNHLSRLPSKTAEKIKNELAQNHRQAYPPVKTFSQWLEINFGKTLCRLFFFPFNKAYTAGLYTKTAPQDKFKNPAIQNKKSGYNNTFFYPKNGLSQLIKKMAEKCRISYHKKVVEINLEKKEILFADGKKIKYQKIISTLPLNKMVQMTKINLHQPPPAYVSVAVVNIGAKKGKKCPSEHWLYLPKSKYGFHRIGFYNNVEKSFAPGSSENKTSIYVEKSYLGGKKPDSAEIKKFCRCLIKELRDWQFITGKPEVVDFNWIDVAYTYSRPGSNWEKRALRILKKNGIIQIGRYGKWRFQGISGSIKDGLSVKNRLTSPSASTPGVKSVNPPPG